MRFLTKICMPVVAIGAAVISAPAMAQNDAAASANAAAATPAQPAQDANSAAVPAQQGADNAAPPSSPGNNQMAMNSTGNAGDLSSIPDTSKKYSRAKRNADNQSEDQTTKQLNQKESSLNGASAGNSQ